jgi:hypothetical protein
VTRLDLQGIAKIEERDLPGFFFWTPRSREERFHVETCEKSSKSEGVVNIRGGRSFPRKKEGDEGGNPYESASRVW